MVADNHKKIKFFAPKFFGEIFASKLDSATINGRWKSGDIAGQFSRVLMVANIK